MQNYELSQVKNECFIEAYLRINSSLTSAVYMRQRIGSALVQIMACRPFGAKPLS